MALEMQLDVEVAITGLGEGAVQGILSGVTPLGCYTTELHTLQVGERVPFYIHLIQNHLTDVYMCLSPTQLSRSQGDTTYLGVLVSGADLN